MIVVHLTFRSCSGTFTDACSDGEYSIEFGPLGNGDTWFEKQPFSMVAGDSLDLLLYTLTPTDGTATPGDYILYNMGVGIRVSGFDIDGNEIEASTWLGSTCPSGLESCAFTRTVSPSAVPVPAAVWFFGTGLVGLVGIKKKTSKVTTL